MAVSLSGSEFNYNNRGHYIVYFIFPRANIIKAER